MAAGRPPHERSVPIRDYRLRMYDTNTAKTTTPTTLFAALRHQKHSVFGIIVVRNNASSAYCAMHAQIPPMLLRERNNSTTPNYLYSRYDMCTMYCCATAVLLLLYVLTYLCRRAMYVHKKPETSRPVNQNHELIKRLNNYIKSPTRSSRAS